MSPSLQEQEEQEHGFPIDNETYYHPSPGLKGWTIHTCWPPAAALEPLIGKRITNTKPPASSDGKKRRTGQLLTSNITHQSPPAKKICTSSVDELKVIEPSRQPHQGTPVFQEHNLDKQPEQSPALASSTTQLNTTPIPSSQSNSPQKRRKLPERGFPPKESVRIKNYKSSSTATPSQKNSSSINDSTQVRSFKSSRIRRAPTSVIHDPSLYDNLSSEQKEVHDYIVTQNKSIFFTGSAGTGKSVLLKALIHSLQHINGPEAVAVTASTGIAACNIGGVTLHSELSIGRGEKDPEEYVRIIRKNDRMLQKLIRLKVLVIDEISMIDAVLFDKIDTVLRHIRINPNKAFGGIQLVLCGDFYQLPPISRHDQMIRYTFQANCWDRAIDMNMELKTVFRQTDQRFANMLNELRLGKVSGRTEREFKRLQRRLTIGNHIEPTELYPLRKELDAANKGRLNALDGEAHIYRSVDTGNEYLYKHCIAPEEITLKVNAQVMLVRNMSSTLVNGSRGVVCRFAKVEGKMFPVVKFSNNTEVLITSHNFTFESQGVQKAERIQLPLILAWALSIHKSQGQTIEYLKIDLKSSFDYGQAYVALSRATCIDNLQVLNFTNEIVKSHPKVTEFYKKMAINSI